MVPYIEYKILEAYLWLKSPKNERGQTTAEYVAVTAVAVGLGVTVIFFTLGGALNGAVESISNKITSFVNEAITDGPGGGGT